MDLTYHQIEGLDEEFGSSFFLLDVNILKSNYRKIDTAFRNRYKNFIIGYSYKTNYLPYLCKELDQLGAYAEVVSRLEYDLAIKLGVNPKKIIFNGPLKTSEDIEVALENGSTLNLDSLYEIEYVRNYSIKNKHKQIKVGLRANFDLSSNGESPLQEGYEVSRFGFCVSNGNFHSAIQGLQESENIQVVGLHGHFSTRERKVETYGTITRKLCELAKLYIPNSIEYIDIGGGIYGELPVSFKLRAPSFDDYAETVCRIMNIEFEEHGRKPYLILEPGISMVANAFTFISKVIDTKKVQDKYFVLIDGSVHNVKPTMHKRNLPMKFVFKQPDNNIHATYNIVGYTCMEKDYLAYELDGQLPIRDDYVIFENVGAYTIVFNPPFIKERPGILAYKNDEFFTVRKKETLREFFNEELYVFNKTRIEVPN